MVNKKWNKLISFCLTLIMVFTIISPYGVLASEGQGNPSGKITLSIDKLTIDKDYVLSPTEVDFNDGESVWDVFQRVMDEHGIPYEYTYFDIYDSVYVESIDGDGEFDHGPGSGWMYNVNGWYPNYGVSQYKLKDGDRVEWRYTTNLGEDLGEDLSEWEDPPSEQNEVDKIALQSAIEAAELNKASVKVSVDGTDVDPSEHWVTEAIMNTYVAEIVSAQELVADETAIQDAVDAKVLALNQATTTFNNAKQFGTKSEKANTVKQQLTKNLAFLHETVDNPSFGTLGGEWSVLALARGEYEVSDGYFDTYYQNVVNEVKRLMPQSGSKPEGRLDRNKGTEHSRAILGLTSIGKDITNVGGYDLREALADFTYVTRQGINGPIFGLIAFDTNNYEIPVIEGLAEQTTREKMINFILDKEIGKGTANAGGWALTGTTPDPDITAMAIQGLTPYYETNSDVKAAVDRALAWLSSAQKEDGGYASWGTVNSESSAQVIVALTGLGIDPHTDSRFIKNGNSAVDALMSFAIPEGGFKHIASGKVDGMATDQGTYALVAYDRFVNGKTSLYDMTDVQFKEVNKTALQAAISSAELNKAPVKVSVDGSDVDPSESWVTEAVMNTYVAEIVSAQELVADETAIQDAVDAKVLALNQATTTFNNSKQIGTKLEGEKYNVTFTVAPKTVTFKLFNSNNQPINIGEGVIGTYHVYSASLPAGHYRYEGFDSQGKSIGGGKLTVTTEQQQEFQFRQLNFKASNSGWVASNDYTFKVGQDSPSDDSLTIGDFTSAGQYPVLALSGKTIFYSFEPSEARVKEGFTSYSGSITITIAGSAQSISQAIPLSKVIVFSIPKEAELFVGRKIKHFISFEEIQPQTEPTINSDGTKTYSFKLMNNQDYNYRVSQTGKLTNTGTFKANDANASMQITEQQLNVLPPNAILNRGTYLEGNIYLNINEQNHLKLSGAGDSFNLLPLRSWQALIEGIGNYFFEPDFHYEIITGGDIISITPGEPGSYTTINALKNGTAIVKVTYDALKVNGSNYIKEADNAFSAIWPENVGLFVVTVGQGETGISTGIESNKERNLEANEGKTGSAIMNLQNGVFDADIDSVYYLDTEPGALFTFTPSSGSAVSVLRPEINHSVGTVSYGNGTFSTENVRANGDGSFTILLTEGRNIVKVEKDGKAEYHVMTARPLTVKIDNLTNPNKAVAAGDQVKVSFEGMSFPSNKLSGIYNFSAQLRFFGGTDNTLLSGDSRQYNITTQANSLTFTVPENITGAYTLHDGHIRVGGFGSPIGDHRNIDPLVGANPNFTASGRLGNYSIFPEITIIKDAINTAQLQSAIEAAELNKAPVKVSVDGLDIDPSEYWVTEAVMNSYVAEIVSAQALVADENAIQDAVDAKVLALNQATTTFNNAKQIGTKSEKANTVKQQLTKNLAYLHETVDNPSFGTLGGEWSVLTLARGEYEVSDGYYETYYQNVVNEVKRLMPQSGSKPEGRLDRNKGTEHSRAILGLTSIGKDITDVGGYDLREALADFTYVTRQGINGPIFGLIAFDTHNYEIPVIEGVAEQTTREKMITFILDKEIGKGTANAGGWALTGTTPDPDITAMAIQGLTPYYETNSDVKAAVDRALAWLSSAQKEDGGYASWGTVNSESCAQVIVALTGLGIDPHTDLRFVKNGNSAVDALMSFVVPEGGFKHIVSGKVDGMATDQGTYALVAYDRFVNGKTSLYDMTDVKIGNGETSTEPEVGVIQPSSDNKVYIPQDKKAYKIQLNNLDNEKELQVTIPEEKQAKTLIELPVNTSLPEIVVNKGNISVEFAKGSMLTSSNAAPIELITTKNHHDETIKTKLYSIIDSNKEIAEIHSAFSMGGSEKVEFDQFVTITFSGMGGKDVAYIQAGQIHSIGKFENDLKGLESGKLEYAYDAGNDLIVKIKHFTDFIFYSKLSKETPDNGGVSPPSSGGGVANNKITLSIDKHTINKGFVLSPVQVEFTVGETVWDVLKRELDKRNIPYSYSYFEKYGSVYVESIAGDGEFDHGSGSGWMYNVSGWYPDYGASKYILKAGDQVQWRYTTNLGADLGEDPSKWEENPSDQREVNKTALLAAIEKAELNKASVKVSVDGIDVDPNKYWVTESVMNAYVAEIVSAQSLITDKNAIQDVVDAKVLALNQATTSFNHAKKLGTKSEKANTVKQQLTKNLAYLHEIVDNPSFGTLGGEWSVLTLARGEYPVSNGYYDIYYNNVANKVDELMKKNGGKLDKNKGTEHSRAILGLTSIGKDITDIGGYDLREALADFNYVVRQGINGPIFALIAFDSYHYEIPISQGVTEQTTREKLIRYILDNEISGGGWALTGKNPDPDITAMAIQGLTPYYKTNPDVKAAVDRALVWLSSAQKEDGGYASWGTVNSESCAQVIVALTGLGIDPHTDSRFVKNGNSAVDALMSFVVPEGGFKHIASGKVDGMATDQGTYALVAYNRFVNGKTSLYDMTDVKIGNGETSTEPEVGVIQPSSDHKVYIPQDKKAYKIQLNNLDNEKELQVTIPEEKQAKTFIELPVNTSLPEIVVNKGKVTVEFQKNSKVTSANVAPIELITTKNHHDETIKTKLYSIIDSNKANIEIHSAFSMGGSEKVEFDQFVTITFFGMAGKDVAYIQAGQIHSIEKFENDQKGLESGKLEYAYDAGNDLIVKTKHFTDFIFYSKLSKETPDNGGVSPPSNGKEKNKITLSIDKFTINKGYVLPPIEVVFYDGESVWDVLQREMDNRGISYSYSYFDKYESIYVESIAGDGEFDHGSGSGWMYNVNGWYPNYGASRYILQDGDVVQWRYTTDLGADLGEDLSKWEDPKKNPTPEITIPVKQNEKNPVVDIPSNIKKDYVLDITKEHKDLDSITINIPNAAEKLSINLEEVKDYIPNIIVKKQNKVFVIDEGTKIRSGKLTIDIFAKAKEPNVATIVKDGLANENIDILDAFSMGSSEGTIFFDKPVTLTLKGMKGNKVGFIEKNKWHTIQMFNSEQEGAQATKNLEMQSYAYENGNDLIIKTNHFTTFVLYTTKEVAFEQVPNEEKKAFYSDAKLISTWAYDLIHEATEKGFVEGYAGKINPKSNVTRAEFAKLMVSVLGLDLKTDKASNFADVKPGDWFYPYVNTAYSEKIVQGFNGKFLPNDNITREEMAVMIARALNLKHAGSTVSLKDNNKISSWAKSAVDTIVSSKLMEGYDNQFKPKDLATREMSIVVAMRAYHYHNKGTNEHTNKDIEKDITEDPKKQSNSRVKKVISETAAFMQKTITDPIVASVGGEWTVFGLARSGEKVPSSYFEKYYGTVEKTLKEKSGVLHTVKYTEYDRVILALTAIGKDIDDVAGYDLRKPLADFNKVIVQGINGPIFALIALDSKNYDIPIVEGVEVQTTREMLVDFILGREIAGGGWALGQNPPEADPDITAMAIQGLSPYYESNEKVKQAVDRAIAWLAKVQNDDGGYKSWGALNSESVAQVIVALTAIGIDPHTDPRFVKNGHSAVDALLSFSALGGGFYHVKPGGIGNGGALPGEVDPMATDQAMYALIAYDRFINGKKRLYDMTDVLN